MSRVHRVKDLKDQVYPHFKIIPYDELAEVLNEDNVAFLEDATDPEKVLRRGTIWKAARKLSSMTKKKIVYKKVVWRVENGESLTGYLFSAEAKG